MNHFATSEGTGRKPAAGTGIQPQLRLRRAKRAIHHSREIVKPAAAISHAGVARTVRFMVRHCLRPIRVADLLPVAGLSRTGFLKSFRKHTGRLPGEVLRLLRMDHARRLLVERDLSLADIAAASGFRKTNSFWVSFRNVTGLAPLEYQRRARAKMKRLPQPASTRGARKSFACPGGSGSA